METKNYPKESKLEKWAAVSHKRFIAAMLGVGLGIAAPGLGGLFYFVNRLGHFTESKVNVDNKVYYVPGYGDNSGRSTVEKRVGPDGREYYARLTPFRPHAVCQHTLFSTNRILIDKNLDGKVDDVYTSTLDFKSQSPTNDDQTLFDSVVIEYNKIRFPEVVR